MEKVFTAPIIEDADTYVLDKEMNRSLLVEGTSWEWESEEKTKPAQVPSNQSQKAKDNPDLDSQACDEKLKQSDTIAPEKLHSNKRARQQRFTGIRKWAQRRKDKKIVLKNDTTHSSALASQTLEKKDKQDPSESTEEATQFCLSDIRLDVPRGSLTAIVGPVGSGKSSLLQALIGEMKQTGGVPARFGGSIGYCPQSAWIQNDTIRGNILFGLLLDEHKYAAVVRASCLESDLEILPHGDLTMIGERGINLSGGQKQRVSIARALYFNPDIILYDDPLSAVDAHVGNHLFEHAIRNTSSRTNPVPQTRILVTHALHFLHRVDHIICIDRGRITETGKFDDLMASKGVFYELVRDFGGGDNAQTQTEIVTTGSTTLGESPAEVTEAKDQVEKSAPNQMQEEEKATGTVGWKGERAFA